VKNSNVSILIHHDDSTRSIDMARGQYMLFGVRIFLCVELVDNCIKLRLQGLLALSIEHKLFY